ncbi:MAG: hypothetical protein AB1589_27765 [Cyanobacteriota bacterium]
MLEPERSHPSSNHKLYSPRFDSLVLSASNQSLPIPTGGKAIHTGGAIASSHLLHFIKGRTV